MIEIVDEESETDADNLDWCHPERKANDEKLKDQIE